jgi:hypothetical protein
MPCVEVKAAKYQTRKAPAFHAKDCKGDTKPGKDGNYISKPDFKGIHKWVKVATGSPSQTKTRKVSKGTKPYLILDNGTRPFRVEVSGKTVAIYKGTLPKGAETYDEMVYNDLLKKLTVKEVHVGKNLCNSNSYLSTTCNKWDDGNTLLLHLDGNKYMFIGKVIYEFEMDDDFEAYYSIIGPNEVPYPITLGSKYVYLMLNGDHKYIPRELFKASMKPVDWADAYAFYHGYRDFETGEKTDCIDRFRMNLEKVLLMECSFHSKFKRWVPIAITKEKPTMLQHLL